MKGSRLSGKGKATPSASYGGEKGAPRERTSSIFLLTEKEQKTEGREKGVARSSFDLLEGQKSREVSRQFKNKRMSRASRETSSGKSGHRGGGDYISFLIHASGGGRGLNEGASLLGRRRSKNLKPHLL